MQYLRYYICSLSSGSLHICIYLEGPPGPLPAPWPRTSSVPRCIICHLDTLPDIALFSEWLREDPSQTQVHIWPSMSKTCCQQKYCAQLDRLKWLTIFNSHTANERSWADSQELSSALPLVSGRQRAQAIPCKSLLQINLHSTIPLDHRGVQLLTLHMTEGCFVRQLISAHATFGLVVQGREACLAPALHLGLSSL